MKTLEHCKKCEEETTHQAEMRLGGGHIRTTAQCETCGFRETTKNGAKNRTIL